MLAEAVRPMLRELQFEHIEPREGIANVVALFGTGRLGYRESLCGSSSLP
jgi:hypothetical protein